MRRVIQFLILVLISVAFAEIKQDAAKYVPEGWMADLEGAVVADFNSDGADDVALVYYRIDPDLSEFNNRINRVMVLISWGRTLTLSVDQPLPYGEDFGTEVSLDYDDGILRVFQHMGFMHRFNEWGLEWFPGMERFWERMYASGGIMGLGSVAGFDAATGLGYVEKVWDDVDISAEYATIYAEPTYTQVILDGYINEQAWNRARPCEDYWVTWGVGYWGEVEDASLEVRSLFDEEYLYLAVEIGDDDLVKPAGEADILAADHLELWFDCFDWESEDYFPELWARKADPYVYQYAAALDSKGRMQVMRWLPEAEQQEDDVGDSASVPDAACPDAACPDAACVAGSQSWTFEIAVPWELLNSSGPADYVPLTVAFSDSDNPQNPKQESIIATSQVSWAEPLTFGSVVTQKAEKYFWGIEPHSDEE